MMLVTKIVSFFLLMNLMSGQLTSNQLPFADMMKVIAGIMQKVNATSNIDKEINNILNSNTTLNEILQQISFQDAPPTQEAVQKMFITLKNINMNSLEKLISGGFDPTSLITSVSQSNVSSACLGELSELMKPLIAGISSGQTNPFQLLGAPVFSMLDAWGKPGTGILIGNLKWIGAMDQCESFDQFQYCRSIFKFLGIFEGRWGVCFPKTCSSQDIDRLLVKSFNSAFQGILSMSEGQTMCNKETEYNAGSIVTILILVLLLFAGLIGTIADVTSKQSIRDVSVTKLKELSGREDQEEKENEENAHLKALSDDQINQPKLNILVRVLICFSIPKNVKALLSTKSPKGAIDCINGIRFISMTWVILGHYFFIAAGTGTIDNVTLLPYETRIFTFMPVANAYVSVDTFFLLSGLLVSYLTLKRLDAKGGMKPIEYLVYLLHRYLRLTPSLIILILANSYLVPLFLSGPFTLEVKHWDIAYRACEDYWWTNILYISNFWPDSMSKQCVGWTWYLANDWQFYVISPAILLMFYYWEKRFKKSWMKYSGAFTITAICCCISFIVTLTLIWKNNYPRLISAFFIEKNPRIANAGAAQDNIYQKPYCRIPAYLVGLLLGYIFSRKIKIAPRLSRLGHVIGWGSAIIVSLAIIYGPWHVFRRENQSFMTDAENIFYGTFHRFAWSVAVAWVIYACHNGNGGWINKFLSWKAFLPLSRMTYGAYLFHYLVLYYYFFISDRPNHIQLELAPFGFVSSVVLSYGVAFLMSIFVELPVGNLEKIVFG